MELLIGSEQVKFKTNSMRVQKAEAKIGKKVDHDKVQAITDWKVDLKQSTASYNWRSCSKRS